MAHFGGSPTDGWGNRHTYFADPLFSNAIFGFDRQTIADIYDQRIPSIPDYLPETRNSRDLYREDGLRSKKIFPHPIPHGIARW